MTEYLGVAPAICGMLGKAGIKAYEFAPSVKDEPCPIVICNERYERTDLLENCEYGKATLDIIAVRETKDEAMSAISGVVYALHKADWEPWSHDRLSIREMRISGLPEELTRDASGRMRMSLPVEAAIFLQLE